MNARVSHSTPPPPHRNLQPLKNEVFDLMIVGGGITGASILRDASLRGLNAILLERGDYASGTTQATSKLIHGGLRYLKNGEIGLVRQSLRERRILATIAPHALRPESFLFPIYRDRGVGRLAMGTALTAYDLLGFDRNRGVDLEHRLPGTRFLDAATTLAEEPGLDFRKLSGSCIYYDYANLNPERLCVELILAARERGAIARNYTEVRSITRRTDGDYEARVNDRRSGQRGMIRSRSVINAGGPWADYLERLVTGRIDKTITRSKGIHVVTRRFVREKTVVLMKPDRTHIFIIPWRGRSLIGTTDTAFSDHPDQMRVTARDVQTVLEDINGLFPGANLDAQEDVEYFYGGLRPLLAGETGKSSYDTSRRTEILHHARDRKTGSAGFAGFFTVLGGKYTTSRHLAQDVVDQVCDYLPGDFGESRSATTPLPAGEFSTLTELVETLERKFPNTDHRKVHVLAGRYGAIAGRILAANSGPRTESGEVYRLGNGEVYYPEEIDYLVRNEDIELASDLFFRRSGIGTIGPAPETVTRNIIDRMGRSLNWGRREKKSALQEVVNRYRVDV